VILRTDAGGGSTANANVTIATTGGVVDLRTSQHVRNVSVEGGLVKLAAGGDKVLRVAAYVAAGSPDAYTGQLDLADNRLILDYTGGPDFSPLATLENQLESGYNAGGARWTGTGVISSTAQGDATAAIGVAEALDILGPGGGTWGGESVLGDAVLARYTKFGDSDLDGAVDFTDFLRLEAGFNKPGHWAQGDFNYDGFVNHADFRLLYQQFGQTIGQPPAPVSAADQRSLDFFASRHDVPEPSGVGVVALGGAMLGRWRRGRRS
jgi:hypothetical protein